MARMIITGAVAFLFLASLVASQTAAAEPNCCVDFHSWAKNTGCSPEQSDDCNTWCQSQCRGGERKPRGGRHFCHCFC
uniref:Knottin scorpion toxin-like domain-containing protein n=1 Tax=Oryza glaberrima TaxID=4538 RepID=I1Q254_ORYGL